MGNAETILWGNSDRANCKDYGSKNDPRSSVWQDFSWGKESISALSQSTDSSKILHVLVLQITSVQWIVAVQNFTVYFNFFFQMLTNLARKHSPTGYSCISYYTINK